MEMPIELEKTEGKSQLYFLNSSRPISFSKNIVAEDLESSPPMRFEKEGRRDETRNHGNTIEIQPHF